jgi:amidase
MQSSHYLPRRDVVYKMSQNNEPALHINSGETVTIETYDCFGDQLKNPNAVFEDLDFDHLNPATGPIYVRGARPGGVLKVEILSIEFAEQGCTEIDGNFGVLAKLVEGSQIWRMAVQNERILFSRTLELDCKPMIGVIGVAPEGDPVPTDCPGIHGGNMDCTLIAPGAALYLPVAAEGALLAVGDIHACMGDGEIGGCGLEIAGKATLRLSVPDKEAVPFPVVFDREKLTVIASAPGIEEAWTLAVHQMHRFLLQETSLPSNDIIMLLSLCGDLAICQTVNPNKTVRMSIPLRYAKTIGCQVP